MLPRKRRVAKTVFPTLARGRSYHTPLASLRVTRMRDCTDTPTTSSVVVSKKVARRAVDRNLLRRRGYGALKILVPTMKPCFVCVFYLKKESASASYQQLASAITTLLHDATII